MDCKTTSNDKDIERISKLVEAQWKNPLTPEMYECIPKHLTDYLEIEQDNPNLMWLYTLLLLNRERFYGGQIIAAMRKRVLEADELTPMAWRYIANGTADDFRIIIDSGNYGITPDLRWSFLVYWLQFMSGLKRKSPISEPVQFLFMNDSMIIFSETEEFHFRGAWVKLCTMRHIIQEAENQLLKGTLDQFVDNELVDVLTWIASEDPVFDHNQTKKGWKYLAKKAKEWKTDIADKKAYQKLKWDSALPEVRIQDWTIEPVTDAWSLRRLALTQRHCGNSFIDDCLNGSVKIFVICNMAGNICATLRLIPVNEIWAVGEIKGFANSEPSSEIIKLGENIAQLYTKHAQLDNSNHKQLVKELTNNDEEFIKHEQHTGWSQKHPQSAWPWER